MLEEMRKSDNISGNLVINYRNGGGIKSTDTLYRIKNIVRAYISDARKLNMDIPNNIENFKLNEYDRTKKLSPNFLKYMLYLRHQLLEAKDSQRKDDIYRLQKWFDTFESALQEIYNCDKLKLEYISKDLSFKISMPDYEPFGLNEMASGYSRFIDILIELRMRMDNGDGIVDYNMPGIILADEIESHLHVELQKRILPFLIDMFPNIQFIVSTHSPFVINSISNAVVYDLEKNLRVEDLSGYSYEGIIEHYFNADIYSTEVKEKFEEYKKLYTIKDKTDEEVNRFTDIIFDLNAIPSAAAKELVYEFLTMERERKLKHG